MSTLTANKTINFEKLLPDFKRFALKGNRLKEAPDNRKVIQYAYYDGQYISVTDSHRLIRVNAAYVTNLPSRDPFLYDIKNKKIVTSESKYPDTNRLIPHYSNTEITINNKQFQAIRNSLNDLMENVKEKDSHIVEIDVTNQTLTLSDRGRISYGHDTNKTGEDIKLCVNCKYIIEALMTVNKLNRLSDDNITMDFISRMRPFTIKLGDIYDIIILPVRVI